MKSEKPKLLLRNLKNLNFLHFQQQLPTEIRLTMEVQSSDFASLHDGREAWGMNDSLSEIIKDTNCIVQFADQYGTLSEANGIFNQVSSSLNQKPYF